MISRYDVAEGIGRIGDQRTGTTSFSLARITRCGGAVLLSRCDTPEGIRPLGEQRTGTTFFFAPLFLRLFRWNTPEGIRPLVDQHTGTTSSPAPVLRPVPSWRLWDRPEGIYRLSEERVGLTWLSVRLVQGRGVAEADHFGRPFWRFEFELLLWQDALATRPPQRK